jgi:hypothetical protein
VSTRSITRSIPLVGLLSFLAASSALAQTGNATIITTARAAGAPAVSSSAISATGEVRPSPDSEYTKTVSRALGQSTWYFLANNTVVVALQEEILMTLRATPGVDGSSWQVSNSIPIGSALYTVTGLVRRGIRNGNGAVNPNRGIAELFLTTVSASGRRATAEISLPLEFAITTNSAVGVINTDTGTFTTAAQGGGTVIGTSTNGGTNGGTSTTTTTTPVTGGGARPLPGWGVRLWPVPWG